MDVREKSRYRLNLENVTVRCLLNRYFCFPLVEKMKLIRRRSLEKLSKMMKNYSCILYFPHTIAVDGTCSVASKMMFIYDSASLVVVDQMSVQLSESNIEQVSS